MFTVCGRCRRWKYDKRYLKCYEDCIYVKPSKDSKIYCGMGSECDAFCDDVTAVN